MSEPAPYMRFFPYAEPYDHQGAAMAHIDDALGAGRDVCFEGACGTGKTLAALVPALEHARATDRTVVITTNVHQQMRQFVEDARAITEQERLRAVVFRGKGSMCHIDVGYEECQTLRDTTRDLVEAERDRDRLAARESQLLGQAQAGDDEAAAARSELMDELEAVEETIAEIEAERATCDHYRRNLATDTDDFYAWLFEDVRTPDDVYDYAQERGRCGYELLKEGVEGVDLVVCNYHHLLDGHIREQFFRWLGRDPEDVVAVFDEAHNVADAARDHARETLAQRTVERAIEECVDEDDPRAAPARNVLTAFRDALSETWQDALAFGEREAVGEDWHDLAVANDDRRDDLTLAFLQAYEGAGVHTDIQAGLELGRDLAERYEEQYRTGETGVRQECQTLQAARFLETWLEEGNAAGQYPVVSVRRTGGDDLVARAELFTCIPSTVTSGLFESLHATVLMSATLRPFDVTEAVLGLDDPETMVFGQPFPAERRRTYAVGTPALFASRRDEDDVQDAVATALEDVVRMTPGNVLAFFPSYSEAERYEELVAGGDHYLDRAGESARELRRSFVEDEDGVLFTSLWGTLGEGVSYDGDDARAVAVVGVPYPHLDDRMAAIQAAYDAAFDEEDAGWQYAVQTPTVRKARQALGRVVRSPEDFGARVLLDERYTRDAELSMRDYAVRPAFPPEERSELVDVDPDKLPFGLLNFFQDVDAYDGDPPSPDPT